MPREAAMESQQVGQNSLTMWNSWKEHRLRHGLLVELLNLEVNQRCFEPLILRLTQIKIVCMFIYICTCYMYAYILCMYLMNMHIIYVYIFRYLYNICILYAQKYETSI